MFRKLKLLVLCLGLTGPVNEIAVSGQVLQDTTSINQIRKCIGYIYNFQFDKANEVYRQIDLSYSGHPAMCVFRGLMIYWENYPLIPTSPASGDFEKELKNCIQLCEKKHDPNLDAEYLLTSLCARGFLLLFYSDNALNLDVFPLATSSYQYIRHSFNYTSGYSDFYFFTGMYDYYREAYPEAYPAYEALAFLFPRGDKKKGLKNIITASENSIFLKAESFTFLSLIYLSFENNFLQASYYSQSLNALYPENPEYRAEYIKNLLLVKNYDEAERIMSHAGQGATNSFYSVQLEIFNGILKEKKYHDYDRAVQLYEKGARDIAVFGDYGNSYAAYCYFGLSRISDLKGDKQYKKIYRKLALKLADFRKINFDE